MLVTNPTAATFPLDERSPSVSRLLADLPRRESDDRLRLSLDIASLGVGSQEIVEDCFQ